MSKKKISNHCMQHPAIGEELANTIKYVQSIKFDAPYKR